MDVANDNVIPQKTTFLLQLPTELILNVLDELDLRTLLLCKGVSSWLEFAVLPELNCVLQVCCFFRNVISETAIFQYKIELFVNGMVDGPPDGLDVATRLDRLVRRQAAWDNLKCTEDKSVDMLAGSVWELYGGVLAQATRREFLTFRQLPSQYRGISERVWTVDVSQIDLRDFTFDNAQDLLVIAEKPCLL
jgi:hypothetical protein